MPIQSSNPPELHTLAAWLGLNQQSRRGSIQDQEEWWNENLFAIGPGNLRSCWGHGPAIYTAPTGVKILRIFFGFIGDVTPPNTAPPPGQYCWLFLSNGNVDQVDLSTHAVTHIGAVWSPVAPYYWADAVVWRPKFIGNTGSGGSNPVGANAVLLMHFNGPNGSTALVDSSRRLHNFSHHGAAALSTAQSRFGTASIHFGTAQDYIIGDGSTDFSFGTKDFTVDFWIYLTAFGGDLFTTEPATVWLELAMSGAFINVSNASGTLINGTIALTLNTWTHIAVIRSSSVTTLYVEGVNSGSASDTSNYNIAIDAPVFGGFNGYMDELRVLKNKAWWTAPFTPPASAWTTTNTEGTTGQQGGVLFGSPKGLYAWDGITLSSPGDTAPDWLTNQQETNPGDPIFTMPIGLPGIYCMEVYQSRLFVAGEDVVSFSAPSNGADFSTTDGGGSFGYFGNKLVHSYTDMAESAGYLFVFGDSSTDLISNVQLAGQGTPEAPFTTNLNYQNVDPQVGQRFPRKVGRIGRYLQMFNGAGIFELRGAEAREIGNKVTNITNTLDTSAYLPTMAPATMFGFRVLLCNGRFTDPFGVTRNLLLMWHPTTGGPEFWSVASQDLELTHIGSYEQDSIITPYGTDGTSLYQLFATPDPALIKRLATKYLRGADLSMLTVKNWKRLFAEIYDNDGRGVEMTGSFTASAGGVPGGSQDVAFSLPPGERYGMLPQPISGGGVAGALDLTSTSPDFTIERIHVLSEERTLYGA